MSSPRRKSSTRASPKNSAKKSPVRRTASPKRSPVKKASPKRSPVKKASPKRSPVKKASPKRSPVKKASPKRRTSVKKIVKNSAGKTNKVITGYHNLNPGKVLQVSLGDKGEIKIKTRDIPTKKGKFIVIEDFNVISDDPLAFSKTLDILELDEVMKRELNDKFQLAHEKYHDKKNKREAKKASGKKGKIPDFTPKSMKERMLVLETNMNLDVSKITDTQSKVSVREGLPGPNSKLFFSPGLPILSDNLESYEKAINFLDDPEQYDDHIKIFKKLMNYGKNSEKYKDFMKEHNVDVQLEPVVPFLKKTSVRKSSPKRSINVSDIPRSPTAAPRKPLTSPRHNKSFSPSMSRLAPISPRSSRN